jgi:hypothetical protein
MKETARIGNGTREQSAGSNVPLCAFAPSPFSREAQPSAKTIWDFGFGISDLK